MSRYGIAALLESCWLPAIIESVSVRKIGDPDLECFVLPTTMNITVPTLNGKRRIVVGYMVPVDERRTQFYQHTCFKIDEDISREQWEAIYPQVAPTLKAIYSDDRAIIEAQGTTETARANSSGWESFVARLATGGFIITISCRGD